MNVVAISGNLTKDPEQRIAGQSPVCSFTVAVSHHVKVGDAWEDRPSFIHVQSFKRAEWLANNLKKGMRVCVSGRLAQRSWTKDGKYQEAVEVIADETVPMAGVGSKQESQPAQQPPHTQGGKKTAIANTQSEYTYGSPIGETPAGTPVYHDVEIPF